MGVGRKHGYEIDLNMLWLEIRRFLIFNTNSLWKSFLITEGGGEKNKPTTLTNGQHVYEDITPDDACSSRELGSVNQHMPSHPPLTGASPHSPHAALQQHMVKQRLPEAKMCWHRIRFRQQSGLRFKAKLVHGSI